MMIDVPLVVQEALLDALTKGNMSPDHAKLIASVSSDFSKAIPKAIAKNGAIGKSKKTAAPK